MTRGAHQPLDVPRSATERFNLGLLLEERGDLATAERAYRQADRARRALASGRLGAVDAAVGEGVRASVRRGRPCSARVFR